jgi:hypothetical protein
MRYSGPSSPSEQIRDLFLKGGIPVTLTLLACNVLTFLAQFLSSAIAGRFIASEMVFNTVNAFHAPWTFLTYPLVSGPFSIFLIVMWVFFWLSAGSLERSWGSPRFAGFFGAVTVVSAASLLLGSLLLHTLLPPLNDLFLPLTALIVAFCMINPTQTLVLYFFPIQARWIAGIVTAWVYFQYGSFLGPLFGLFSLGGILAAFLFVRFGRSWSTVSYYTHPPSRGPDLRIFPAAKAPTVRKMTLDGSRRRSPLDLVGRWQDWKVRRRTERLLRNSGFSDQDPRWRDRDGDENRPR